MAVNPSLLRFRYKQLSGLFTQEIANYIEPPYKFGGEISRVIVADGAPNWLTIVKQAEGEARVTLNANVAALTPGTRTVSMPLSMLVTFNDAGLPGETLTQTYRLGSLDVRLVVESTVRLSATPNPVLFNYTLGNLPPEPVTVTVNSEIDWTVTKTKTWVSLSSSAGVGIGSFVVDVEPIGLAVGTHTDTLTITDLMFTTTVLVSLTITEADTGTTYLYVQPSAMTINYTVSGYLPSRQVELNASGNWTATASQPWVALSQNSGFAGVAFLTLTLVETEALALTEGVYSATVVFEQGGLVKTIYITLNVFQLVESLPNDVDLYYTDDNNLIILSSLREDTFLAIEMSSSFENNVDYGKFAIPFYAGRGERRLGNFPKKVIGRRSLPLDVLNTQLFPPYPVALVNLSITEEDIVSDQVFQTVPVNNVRFIKGITPSNDWMSEMPEVRFLTKKGIAAFSVLANGSVATTIDITGDINTSFTLANGNSPFYTAWLPLENVPGLQVGHEIDVTVLTKTVKIHIAPDGRDHAVIFWENKWGCYDTFECTGEVEVQADFDTSEIKLRKDYQLSELKTLSIETSNAFTINTGWVRSAAEIMGLQNLLNAVNVYVLYNGVVSQVNNTTKKLQLSATDREEPSFNLTFDKSIS